MKSFLYSVLFLAIFAMQSCHCNCTDVACDGNQIPFRFQFSKVDYVLNELDSVWVIRKNLTSSIQDTIRIDAYIDQTEYWFDFVNFKSLYSEGTDFEVKDYQFLVLNGSTNQLDTIANINYDIEMISEVCNLCEGVNCVNEYYDIKVYDNPTFSLNGTSGIGYAIVINKP